MNFIEALCNVIHFLEENIDVLFGKMNLPTGRIDVPPKRRDVLFRQVDLVKGNVDVLFCQMDFGKENVDVLLEGIDHAAGGFHAALGMTPSGC